MESENNCRGQFSPSSTWFWVGTRWSSLRGPWRASCWPAKITFTRSWARQAEWPALLIPALRRQRQAGPLRAHSETLSPQPKKKKKERGKKSRKEEKKVELTVKHVKITSLILKYLFSKLWWWKIDYIERTFCYISTYFFLATSALCINYWAYWNIPVIPDSAKFKSSLICRLSFRLAGLTKGLCLSK